MIDPKLLKLLSAEQQTELREFEKLFESAGWKMLKSQIELGHQASITRLINAETWADNRFQKGAAAAYNDVLGAEERVATKFEAVAQQILEDQRQADEDAELDYE